MSETTPQPTTDTPLLLMPDDDHTSDGRCKYPTTCTQEQRHTPAGEARHLDRRVRDHIQAVCNGLDVMAQVLNIIVDREEVTSEQVLALTPDDVTALYDGYLDRAIGNIERSLLGDYQ